MPSPCIPLLNNVKKDFPIGLKKYLRETGKRDRQSTTCAYCLFTPSFLSIAYYHQNNITTVASSRLQRELITPTYLQYHVIKSYKISAFILEIRKLLLKTREKKWDGSNFTYAKLRLNYKTVTFTPLFINADIRLRFFVHNIRHASNLALTLHCFAVFLWGRVENKDTFCLHMSCERALHLNGSSRPGLSKGVKATLLF